MKEPFTEKEQEIMDLLVEAHIKFISLKNTHPNESSDWLTSFHRLQGILGERVLRRDYPSTFYSLVTKHIDSNIRVTNMPGHRNPPPPPPKDRILKEGEQPRKPKL